MGTFSGPRHILAMALVFTLAFLSLPAWAQEKHGKSSGPVIDVWGGGLADADVGTGQVSATSVRAQVSYKGFSFSYQRSDYIWDNVVGLPFGNGKDEPWEALQIASLGYRHNGKINQDWSWFGNLRVYSAFESEMDGSLGVGVMGGVRYRINRQWGLTMGTIGRYHPVESLVLPIVGLSWNETTQQGFSAEIGFPRSSLSYRFNPGLALHLKMLGFNQSTYRLADDSHVQPSGYMKVDDLITGLQLEYSPIKQLRLEASVIYAFNRTFTAYNKDGDNETEYDVDNALGGILRVVYRF